MKTLDLLGAVPDTLSLLQEGGEGTSVMAVLESLGVQLSPTLRSSQPPDGPGAGAAGSEYGDEDLLSLGRFQLVGELGSGGMGRVLEARDPELRRSVAVKVFIDPRRVSEVQLARFVAEAQITSQLEHPNIVPVYDMGLSLDGQLYFVMKKVEGRSLHEVLNALRTAHPETAAEWGRHRLLTSFLAVCNAVAYAHDRGVLHRDLKPSNIMLGPFGEVLVMDWGVARLMGDTTEVVQTETIEKVTVAKTLDGAAIGTPGYMSPEQARGSLTQLDERSDVWSLGAILYELLTLTQAYEGNNLYGVMFAAMSGPPADLEAQAREHRLPDEIVGVVRQALAADRGDRFSSVSELARAVEAFLEGSKRRAAAARCVAEADEAWDRYGAIVRESDELIARERSLNAALAAWAPLDEKAALLALREQLATVGSRRTRAFADCVAAAEQALSHDPGNPDARRALARVYYMRFEEAEALGAEEDTEFYEDRVLRYDDGRYAPLLKGMGALTVQTDPPGAEVICERFERTGLIWPTVGRRVLGRTPLQAVAMEPGSYLLTLRSPGKRDVRYPLWIPRGRHWDTGSEPVTLYTDEQIGRGFAYVPAGPFLCGGDPDAFDSLNRGEPWLDGFSLSVLPVTIGEYCEFINALHLRDADSAWARVPGQKGRLKAGGGQYWKRPGPGEQYVVPVVDDDGDRWDRSWPIFSISWHDAVAYTEWMTEREGVVHRLPTEREWEKAARSVDGRTYPWGDRFDATLCKMRDSRPGGAEPEPVGTFSRDVSVYGVRDLAGSMREWCADEYLPGTGAADRSSGRQTRVFRGGSWSDRSRFVRSANRDGGAPDNRGSFLGFRLAKSLP